MVDAKGTPEKRIRLQRLSKNQFKGNFNPLMYIPQNPRSDYSICYWNVYTLKQVTVKGADIGVSFFKDLCYLSTSKREE